VSPRLHLTTSRDILDALARGEGPERAIVALGYAGWDAGQLEDELAQNAWLTVTADERLLFDIPVEERWHAAGRLLGVDLMHLSSDAGHA
jgi:putative transcriptional regulator